MNAAHRPVYPAPDPLLCSAPPPTARSRLLAAMTTAPAPRQPPIGPTGTAEGADWRGWRRGPAGGQEGGQRGAPTLGSQGEAEPRGTWRSAMREGKPRPFLLWLSCRSLWSRVWAGEVLSRVRDKNPRNRLALGCWPAPAAPWPVRDGLFKAHFRPQASLRSNTPGVFHGRNLTCICNLTHPRLAVPLPTVAWLLFTPHSLTPICGHSSFLYNLPS